MMKLRKILFVLKTGIEFCMIRVEGGTFMMGAADNDAWFSEKPIHQVTLSDFYIGETEVTQELWEAVMGDNPSDFKGNNRPVERVSWNDCQEFIRKLNTLTGQKFRLPTEAEWEFAARGGNNSKGFKYSGGKNLDTVAWYCYNSNNKTHPVKRKSSNELGIYDMSGNVREWCQDWYGPYSNRKRKNPTGPRKGSYRVVRGESWDGISRNCRITCRDYESPDFSKSRCTGLRLALKSFI